MNPGQLTKKRLESFLESRIEEQYDASEKFHHIDPEEKAREFCKFDLTDQNEFDSLNKKWEFTWLDPGDLGFEEQINALNHFIESL